ncbi:MAG: hypothetical protein WBD07_13300 [Vicinamibacterales bacterium]
MRLRSVMQASMLGAAQHRRTSAAPEAGGILAKGLSRAGISA